MAAFRWGIFGTGAISLKFGLGLRAAVDAEVAFVASRSQPKAQKLASALSAPRAIEGYAEAARAGGVDAIYVATPPSAHVEHARLCLEAGVPVLVEKPIALTAADSARIAETARSHGVFAMEAMWTRFLPAAQELRKRVIDGAVGEVQMVTGSFGMSWTPEASNGLFQPALGGGAMTHLGAYPLSLGQWLFGTPNVTQATASIGDTGVDENVAFQLRYSKDILGSFVVTLRGWAPDGLHVLGSHGLIGLRGGIVRPHGLSVSKGPPLRFQPPSPGLAEKLRQSGFVHRLAQDLDRSSRRRGKNSRFHYLGNGFHYEADEVRSCIQLGQMESDIMPLRDSVSVAATLDEIRRAIRMPSAK